MERGVRVLVIDDERDHAEAMAETLRRIGCTTQIATSGREGIERISERNTDIVVTDLVMRDVDGMEVLEEAKKMMPDIEVVVVTGYGSPETAVEAMKKGAETYLTKPVNRDALETVIQKVADKQALARRNVELERQLDKKYGFEGIIGNSERMQRMFDTLQQISPTNATVLIQGESGTGKELIARAIHNNSPRRGKPFVALNCAALSEGILESELFGHEKGAFTGAYARRIGRFEYAHHGTLLLDEIGDMPMSTQIKFPKLQYIFL